MMNQPAFIAPLTHIATVVLFQSTILLLLGFIVAAMIGPRRLALLSLIYRSLLVGVLLIGISAVAPLKLAEHIFRPIWSLSLQANQVNSTSNVPLMARPTGTVMASDFAQAISKHGVIATPKSHGPSAATADSTSSNWNNFVSSLITFWLIVASVKLIWLGVAGLYAARLRCAAAVDDADDLQMLQQLSNRLKVRAPVLVSHPQIEIPFLSGLLRPVIALPRKYKSEFEPTALRAVLLHELAHLQRRDCGWRHLAGFAGAVLWIQPLIWLLRRRLEQTDELLCDETVLHNGCSPSIYANVLLSLSERLSMRPPEQACGAGIVTFRSALGQRIRRIMDYSPRIGLPVSKMARLATLTGMMVAVTSVLTLLAVDAAPQKTATSNPDKYDRIPQNNTPEVEVGLPATLEEAHGNSSITGRVVYENGKPAAGIRVYAFCRWVTQTELWGHRRTQANHYRWPDKIDKLLSADTVTHADGTYRFTGLLPQRYSVGITPEPLGKPKHIGFLAGRGAGIDTVANQTRQARDLVLRKSALVEVRVVDQESGVPLPGIMLNGFILDTSKVLSGDMHVDAYRKMRPVMRNEYDSSGYTDKDGNCTLSLSAGKAYVYVDGGWMMEGLGLDDPKVSGLPRSFPDAIINSNGVYKSNSWCIVIAPQQAPHRAWKGESEFQLTKEAPAKITIQMKKYMPLTSREKMIFKWRTNYDNKAHN